MATDLSSLLGGGAVLIRSNIASRKQALEALAGALSDVTKIDSRDIFDAAMQRERLGSTGVGEGVAIPHARLADVKAPIGALLVLGEGVDFDAVDERPCDIIFMLLAPMTSGADHLRALAQVSRAFRHGDVRERLRQATTPAEIMSILCDNGLTADTAA